LSFRPLLGAATLAKTARFGERILFLSGKLFEPTLGINQHVVWVYETLLELTVEPANVIPVLMLAADLALQKLGVGP